jgi:hypothetical protein
VLEFRNIRQVFMYPLRVGKAVQERMDQVVVAVAVAERRVVSLLQLIHSLATQFTILPVQAAVEAVVAKADKVVKAVLVVEGEADPLVYLFGIMVQMDTYRIV